MKAITYSKTGPSSVLNLVEREIQEPGSGEVRVKIVVSGVNPTDWKARAGNRQPLAFDEVVPNQDGAGIVDAVGDHVQGLSVGDRVWVMLAAHGRPTGTAQEFAVVPKDRV
ncbi:MAG TPA: alcohol dehydrogenase catalytic domain-containing protein, partial [Glaciihabitans sp.]|nr:alcohol dehydrogenase catalytic domain-containing protein [Glaciihabitans sp.]